MINLTQKIYEENIFYNRNLVFIFDICFWSNFREKQLKKVASLDLLLFAFQNILLSALILPNYYWWKVLNIIEWKNKQITIMRKVLIYIVIMYPSLILAQINQAVFPEQVALNYLNDSLVYKGEIDCNTNVIVFSNYTTKASIPFFGSRCFENTNFQNAEPFTKKPLQLHGNGYKIKNLVKIGDRFSKKRMRKIKQILVFQKFEVNNLYYVNIDINDIAGIHFFYFVINKSGTIANYCDYSVIK